VAKASSLKPRPSLLYLEAQMSGRNVSWVDKEATHCFMILSSQRSWGLPTRRAGKLINMRFRNDEPHDINEVALHVTFLCETLEFVEISQYVKLVRCTSFWRTPSLNLTW
jgi:hypothetical protein